MSGTVSLVPRSLSCLLAFSLTALSICCFGNDSLIRSSYFSSATGSERDYFIYLPDSYDGNSDKKWPVIFFLHGHGQRGDGKEDLDYILRHGPLMQAWIQRKNLPFIIVSPQLPRKFGIPGVHEDHSKDKKPERLKQGVPPENPPHKSSLPIARRSSDEFPDGGYKNSNPTPLLKAGLTYMKILSSFLILF